MADGWLPISFDYAEMAFDIQDIEYADHSPNFDAEWPSGRSHSFDRSRRLVPGCIYQKTSRENKTKIIRVIKLCG